MDKRERMRIISELGDIIQFNWERRISNPEELLNDFLKHPNIAIVERNGNNIRELAPMLNSEGNIEPLPFKFQRCEEYKRRNKNNSIGGL
jgi:hypothetical protein